MTINELGKIASSYKWEVWRGVPYGETTVEQDYYVCAVISKKRGIVKFNFGKKRMPNELILAIIDYANTKKKERGGFK